MKVLPYMYAKTLKKRISKPLERWRIQWYHLFVNRLSALYHNFGELGMQQERGV